MDLLAVLSQYTQTVANTAGVVLHEVSILWPVLSGGEARRLRGRSDIKKNIEKIRGTKPLRGQICREVGCTLSGHDHVF